MLRKMTVLLATLVAMALAACGGDSVADSASTTQPTTPTGGADTTRPTTPTGVVVAAGGSSAINLLWNASTDNVGVTGYIVRRNGTQVGTPATTSFVDTGLSAGTTYTYTVAARDAAGNNSSLSTSASATTTGTGDTTRPSTPTGLTATVANSSVVNLSWNASTDNVGVTGYIVRRNGTQVATPVTTSFSDTSLSAGTTYRYTVAATDAAGNNSFLSTNASATTSGTPPPGGQIPPTLGWYQIPNTRLRTVCPSPSTYPQIQGAEGCAAVVDDWAGGTFDTARNRMLIWGGGHGGYAGNEVYALNINTLTITRLNEPSTSIRDGCTSGGTYSDGTPVSRHSYNHLAYLPNQDAMFSWGGSQWQCGFLAGDTWLFNLANLSWTKKSSANGPRADYGRAVSFDPNTNLVYARDDFDFYSYNPATDIWSKRNSTSLAMNNNKTAVVDPVRKKYYLHGNGTSTLYWYDISSPTASVPIQSGQTTGCGGFIGNYQAGMEYDPVQDRIVGWDGGNTIFILNPDTLSCTTVSHSGGPVAVANGTFGRFRYSPASNVFVVCNSVDSDCHALRLTP